MLVEQRLPVVLGDALLAHHALVLAERLSDLARSFFGFHLVVREVLLEMLPEPALILDAEEVGTEMDCLGLLNTRGARGEVPSWHWEILTDE